MADIVIRGISMPHGKDHITITVNANGTVQKTVDVYCKVIAKAIELPEHGDLIDRSKIKFSCAGPTPEDFDYALRYAIDRMPVIVPADKEDTP